MQISKRDIGNITLVLVFFAFTTAVIEHQSFWFRIQFLGGDIGWRGLFFLVLQALAGFMTGLLFVRRKTREFLHILFWSVVGYMLSTRVEIFFEKLFFEKKFAYFKYFEDVIFLSVIFAIGFLLSRLFFRKSRLVSR